MPSRRPPIRVLTTQGVKFVGGLSDRDASTVGAHWNAVRRYLDTGEDYQLAGFDDVEIDGEVLETGIDAIEYWAIRGEVRFDDIYDEVT
jgi:hypothetical protein